MDSNIIRGIHFDDLFEVLYYANQIEIYISVSLPIAIDSLLTRTITITTQVRVSAGIP